MIAFVWKTFYEKETANEPDRNRKREDKAKDKEYDTKKKSRVSNFRKRRVKKRGNEKQRKAPNEKTFIGEKTIEKEHIVSNGALIMTNDFRNGSSSGFKDMEVGTC
ncbi:MAG: hypothetical protein ACXADY_04895 [Candidatus Hodarchaeales archaeon]